MQAEVTERSRKVPPSAHTPICHPFLGTLPCRDAWGRLQRQSGAGWGGKPAQVHPAPFGAAPGAYRSTHRAASEE